MSPSTVSLASIGLAQDPTTKGDMETTSPNSFDEAKSLLRADATSPNKASVTPRRRNRNHQPPLVDVDSVHPTSETSQASDDNEQSSDAQLRHVLRRSLKAIESSEERGRRLKLRDVVFTPQTSPFDRLADTTGGTYRGFYNLAWVCLCAFTHKMAMHNWTEYGNPFGAMELPRVMFGDREVLVLLFADGILCGTTGFSWLLQVAVKKGHIDWDRWGWITQHAWQAIVIHAASALCLIRPWPWSHQVYFLLHAFVMVMKQHSYAYTNGRLSTVLKKRQLLLSSLKQLELIRPAVGGHPSSAKSAASSASAAPDRRDIDRMASALDADDAPSPLGADQVEEFETVIKREIDEYTNELKGTATDPARSYPNNLTAGNFYEFVVLPTLVYEQQYPRSDRIDWSYVGKKLEILLGISIFFILFTQAYIYPTVIEAVALDEAGLSLSERFRLWPSLFDSLYFPLSFAYLVSWYLIWETALNIFAEITRFADRSFYGAWWNSETLEDYSRRWNRPVHIFLLRHVYNHSILSMRVSKQTAAAITILVSAWAHEIIMYCLFKKIRGHLSWMMLVQLPLAKFGRSSFVERHPMIANALFLLGQLNTAGMCTAFYILL